MRSRSRRLSNEQHLFNEPSDWMVTKMRCRNGIPDAAGWLVIDCGFGAHIATGRQCGRAASDDYYEHIPDADWSRAARLCFYAYRRRTRQRVEGRGGPDRHSRESYRADER